MKTTFSNAARLLRLKSSKNIKVTIDRIDCTQLPSGEVSEATVQVQVLDVDTDEEYGLSIDFEGDDLKYLELFRKIIHEKALIEHLTDRG